MDGKLLFCVSVGQGDHLLYGPEWKEAERGKSLIDLFLQVCGSKVLGQQVQVLVSKDREFLEAAVVQVCAPLSHLSEKSQSYIKFIIKSDHQLTKNAFALAFSSDRDVNNSSNYKQPQDLIASLCINDPLTTEKWLLQSDTTTLHSLTSKPAFENMTVEEICDEIRRIRKVEMSKNKLPAWIEEEKKHINSGSNNTTNGILKETEIKEKVPRKASFKGSGYTSPDKSKAAVVPKSSITKSSPIPKRKPDVKRAVSFRSNKSFKRLSETTRNKLNGKNKPVVMKSTKVVSTTKSISERLSILAQPRKRHSDPGYVTSPTAQGSLQLHASRNVSINKRSMEIKQSVTTGKKATSMERVNKKSCLTRGSTSNSTFIKMGADNDVNTTDNNTNKKFVPKPKGKKKTDSSQQYFIKIYTKDNPNVSKNTECQRTATNLSKTNTIHDLSKDNFGVKHSFGQLSKDNSTEQNYCNISNTSNSNVSKEFSKDSLMNNTADSKSIPTMPEYTPDDFIPECISPLKIATNRYTCSSPVKQCIDRSFPEYSSSTSSNRVLSVDNLLTKINADSNRNRRSRPESLSFDDRSTKIDNFIFNNFMSSKENELQSTFDKMNHKNNEFVEAEKLEKNIVNLSREILNSSDNTSIENIIDNYFSPSPVKTPTKSPLFMQLLEKNNLKHSSVRSADTSLDDIKHITEAKSGESVLHSEHEKHSSAKPGFVLSIRERLDNKMNSSNNNNNYDNHSSSASNITNNLNFNTTTTNNNNINNNNHKNNCSSGSSNISSNKASNITNNNFINNINLNNNNDNTDNDKCSKIPINAKKSPLKNRTDETEKIWANSRGIKFLKDGNEKRQPLALIDLESEDKSLIYIPPVDKSPVDKSPVDKSPLRRSPSDKSPLRRSPSDKSLLGKPSDILLKEEKRLMRLPLTPLQSTASASSPCICSSGTSTPTFTPRTGTPDRNRKVWGNGIDGMDTMLIPSLQAFSLELRSLSETVTSNLITLYDNFQQKFEGLDVESLNKSKTSFASISPRLTKNGGDQQGVAMVFRNLRKIEGQMRTIELATVTMLKALDVNSPNQGNSLTKGDEVEKDDLNTTRIVSWNDLKNTPYPPNCNVKCWLSDQDRAREFSSDSIH